MSQLFHHSKCHPQSSPQEHLHVLAFKESVTGVRSPRLTDRTLRMARGQERKRRRIHDSQSFYTKNPSLRIHHSISITRPTHRASPRCVINARCALHHRFEDILIARHVQSRESFRPSEYWLYDVCLEDFSCAPESCDGHLLVAGIKEPIRADDRIKRRVRGVDGDVAPGEGSDEAGE